MKNRSLCRTGGCEPDWSGSGYGPLAGSCEHGNKPSYFTAYKHFVTSLGTTCFSTTLLHRVSFIPGSPLAARSRAVVRSHIWMAPLLWPVKINLRGRDPIRLEPSHSWTQNEVTVVPSTALMTHTLSDSKQCAPVTLTSMQANKNSGTAQHSCQCIWTRLGYKAVTTYLHIHSMYQVGILARVMGILIEAIHGFPQLLEQMPTQYLNL